MLTQLPQIVQATEFRKNFAKYLKEAAKKPLFVSTKRGGETLVVLDSDMYNKLVAEYMRSFFKAEPTIDNIRVKAEAAGGSELSLDDINALIKEAREASQKK